MLLYTDIITGDELLSDAFDVKEVGITYEVDCEMITVKEGEVDIGANASAEGPDEDEPLEDGAQRVNNIIHAHQLQSTTYDKKSYTAHIKRYLKDLKPKVVEKAVKEAVAKNTDNPDFDVTKFTDEFTKTFEANFLAHVKKVLASIKDYEFYVGESVFTTGQEGMVILLNYREDGTTPYLTYLKDGIVMMKV